MGLKAKLKQLGLTQEQIDSIMGDVSEHTNAVVKDRLARAKRNNDFGSGGAQNPELEKLQAEVQKQIEENEKLKTLTANSEEAKTMLEERIQKLQQEMQVIDEKKAKAFETQMTDLRTENEKLQVQNKKIYSDYKNSTLTNKAFEFAKALNLQNPEYASKWLVNNGFIDLEKQVAENGDFVGYQFKTPEISYMDKELEKQVKKSFIGEDNVKQAIEILANQNNEFKTLFPIMAKAASGTGVTGGHGTGQKSFDDLTTDEIFHLAAEHSGYKSEK
jgi:hypothetical protein